MKRRSALAAVASLATLSLPAVSNSLTGKTMRIVVPFSAGGPTDVQARALAVELSRILGTTVIVDNKPGAGGTIGGAEVARSPADGLTLLYTHDGALTQTPHMLLKPPYDPLKDFTPISRAAIGGVVLLTHPSIPGRTVKELVDYARKNPGKVSYASFGVGTASHIYGELLAKSTNTEMIHVPYKGTSDAMNDLLAGRVQFTFNAPSVVSQYVPTGKLKVIAVTGDRRVRLLPDVPTMSEAGFAGFETAGYVGMFAPSGIKPDMLAKLHEAIGHALKQPAVIAVWNQQAFDIQPESPAEAARILRRDYAIWGKYMRDVGIQPQ